jgi:DNA-binding transcriptional ArsR family regulator
MVHHPDFRLDAVFAALGEPTRRAVVERLGAGEATVTELAAPFGISLQAFIKHVKVLEEAGVVRLTRIGRANHVALVPEALQAAGAWLGARAPLALPPARVAVDAPRRADLLARARSLHGRLAPRMALLRRALAGGAPEAEAFEPGDAYVRALRAVGDRRPMLEEALRLFDALTLALAAGEQGDLDALRETILPLGRLMFELRALLPIDRAAA